MSAPNDRFLDAMSQMAQAEGAPPIAGRIVGYLILAGEPRTLGQMTEDLAISKASASTNARLLEKRGALRHVSVAHSRQDAYELCDEPGLQTLIGMSERFRANAGMLASLALDLSPEGGLRERVERIANFHRKSADFLDEWRERVAAEMGPPDSQAGDLR